MSRYSTSLLGCLSTRRFKRSRKISAKAKKTYKRFLLEETEIPTAPPSPIAMPLDSRKLRRHDTFFYEETMQEKEKKIRNQKKHTDDQEKQLDLKECYLEVSLQNTPSEEIPNDMSREAFVMQGLNR
ncbi:hypothetical protein EV361DRAFT_1036716 [Lentinula raphanica]|nr:hypothetical protein EV361DRAFT_1036716 [Lentinula raphanica]